MRCRIGPALAAIALVTLHASAAFAADQGTFGLGLGGTFNFTSTTNEVTPGETVDNSTLFLRASPRAEYFFADNVPVTVRLGFLARSLDRGVTNANETDGIFTVGSGYHVYLNQRFSVIAEAELGGYVGASTRTLEINNVSVEESTDTRGFAFGAGLNFAYMMGEHSQLRAGLDYTGLVGSEELSDGETLSATTHAAGLSLGFVYFF